jgi:YidC/Oxa1 family membrane protein insertase
MNKNTVIGITLIGLILIGFSIYNSRQYSAQQEQRRIQDSIETVRAVKYAEELASQKADSLGLIVNSGDSALSSTNNYKNVFSNQLLEDSYNADAQYYTLENNNIKIVFSSKGAQAYSVLIKDYMTYDSLPLMLMKEDASNFNIQLFSSQTINTQEFAYSMVESSDSSLVFRLFFAENSYIEHSYSLPTDSYMLDFNFRLVGMENIIPKNVTQFDLSWNLNVPRLERGYDNEKNYSTIVYKYPSDASVETLGLRKDNANQSIKTKFSWFAFQQQFFSAILLSPDNFTSGDLGYDFYDENDESKLLMACSSKVLFPYKSGADVSIPFKFYYGPNHFKTLKSYDYGFEKIVPLGGSLIGWINRFIIIPIFDFLNRYISNFGIIILILTVLVKIVISPLTIKSYMSSAKMRVLKPEIDKINAKYPRKEDAMKKQQETMDLYKKSGVSMFGGCLPMLIQFPILFAMFRFFPASFELRQEGFLWATDLSTYDSILDLPFRIPLYGDHISLFAILMAVSMFFYSKMTADQMSGNPQMAGMKFMTLYFMPVFMLILCNNFSSGLSYYYMLSNIFTMLQTWVIRKYFVDEEKIFAKLKENSAKAAVKPKSKFQQRLEAAAKAQQEAMKQQKRR